MQRMVNRVNQNYQGVKDIMNIRLHANATTTPKIRTYIQQSRQPVSVLASELGVSEPTIRKWQKRKDIEDASHTPHHLPTTLSPEEEYIVTELRKTLLLPLDDLLRVTRAFINPKVSRAGLARCLRRRGISRLQALFPTEVGKKTMKRFKDYIPGFVHIDVKYLPQMADENQRSYLFVAIDRATRWVYLEILPNKSKRASQRFPTRLIHATPFHIHTILTDNGKEFTDRFSRAGERKPTGNHLFDRMCYQHHIEHRLIKPRRPQTNGMVERFNGRIAKTLKTTTLASYDDLSETLQRYLDLYNYKLPQKALNAAPPIEALKCWYQSIPECFKIKPYNLTRPNT